MLLGTFSQVSYEDIYIRVAENMIKSQVTAGAQAPRREAHRLRGKEEI